MNELESLITRCQDAYYSGKSLVSDAEFDALWAELRDTCPESPVLRRVGDTQNHGYRSKARHIVPMGSQKKVHNPAEFRLWTERWEHMDFAVQWKLDGASLELQYENGVFARALTRGDGKTGADITDNARRMVRVPECLNIPFTGGIRGEVLMDKDTWESKYTGKRSRRDTANGIMLHKDGVGCEDLRFIAYDCAAYGNDRCFTCEPGKIKWLADRGFAVVESREFSNIGEIECYRLSLSRECGQLPVEIDGLVVKKLKTDMVDLRQNYPNRQIAYKFSEAVLARSREKMPA